MLRRALQNSWWANNGRLLRTQGFPMSGSGTECPFAAPHQFVRCWGHFGRVGAGSRPVNRDPKRPSPACIWA